MELDKKIKVKKIFDCFSDVEEVKKYYGKEVYCADFIENFSNLKLYTDKTKLKTFFPQECKPFLCGGRQHRYVLPCEFVEQEKQYRAFTIDEFMREFTIGNIVTFRHKVNKNAEYRVIYNGYRIDSNSEFLVYFGIWRYTLQELFNQYELLNSATAKWQLFGVEE